MAMILKWMNRYEALGPEGKAHVYEIKWLFVEYGPKITPEVGLTLL